MKDILSMKNVVGAGYGRKYTQGRQTKQEAYVVMVSKKVPVSELDPQDIIPSKFAGIITDVLEVGGIKALSEPERVARQRPAFPGVSIGHYEVSAGTLGAVVYDNDTGDKLILSNNHVLANTTDGKDGKARIGDTILQPGAYDGGTDLDAIGELLRFIPIKGDATPVTCPWMLLLEKFLNYITRLRGRTYQLKLMKMDEEENLVDAAVAQPYMEDLVMDEIMGVGLVQGIGRVDLGEIVKKSGRTTGITEGEVIIIDAAVRVNMGDRMALFTDQTITTNMSAPGDSGSLVLNTGNKAVGLLFAGSNEITVLNKIENVLDLLRVHFLELV